MTRVVAARVCASVVFVALAGLVWFASRGGPRSNHLPAGRPEPRFADAAAPGLSTSLGGTKFDSLASAVAGGCAALGPHDIAQTRAAALAKDTEHMLAALGDETSITFEDIALRKRLRLPRGLAHGTDAQRLAYWKDTTAYFRNLDVDVLSVVIRVRDATGRALAGPRVGRELVMRFLASDEARSAKVVYEVVFTGIAREGPRAGQAVRFGLLMVDDAPDRSWRLCGVSHYDVPNTGESRPAIPVAYPPQ